LFFFYLIVSCWLLTKFKFVKDAGLPAKIVIGIFLLKIVVGLVYGRMIERTHLSDSWSYHYDGLEEYQLLWQHPLDYFSNIFQSGYQNKYGGILQSQDSFWNDLKNNLMVKFVSILHIFSGGNYYINVILYNFLLFFGNIGLFRFFTKIYRTHAYLLVIITFLLPSVLLFTSTIHKDGIVLAALGIFFFNFYEAVNNAGFTSKRILYCFFAVLLIFCFRNFVLIALFPALIGWLISYFFKCNH